MHEARHLEGHLSHKTAVSMSPRTQKTPPIAGLSSERTTEFEPATFSLERDLEVSDRVPLRPSTVYKHWPFREDGGQARPVSGARLFPLRSPAAAPAPASPEDVRPVVARLSPIPAESLGASLHASKVLADVRRSCSTEPRSASRSGPSVRTVGLGSASP